MMGQVPLPGLEDTLEDAGEYTHRPNGTFITEHQASPATQEGGNQ